MGYEGIIFDLDATLVYTEPSYRYRVVGKTLEEFGTQASREHIDQFWFMTGRDQLIKRHFGVDPSAFWRSFHNHDTTELRGQFTKPYEDTEALVKLAENFKLGIVTGAPRHIAELEIEMIGVDFDAVVVAHMSEGIIPKPDPDGLLRCLRLMNLGAGDAPFVGNSDEDILAARNAKMYGILIDRNEHNVSHVSAPQTINSLYELGDLIS